MLISQLMLVYDHVRSFTYLGDVIPFGTNVQLKSPWKKQTFTYGAGTNPNLSLFKTTRESDVNHPFNIYRPQTKLREGNVYTGVRDSVHRGGVCSLLGGACSQGVGCLVQWGVPAPRGGGVPGPVGRGACSRGVWSQGGCLVWGCLVLGGACSRGVPGGDTLPPPPPNMATAVGGTHPTGMHSCWHCFRVN